MTWCHQYLVSPGVVPYDARADAAGDLIQRAGPQRGLLHVCGRRGMGGEAANIYTRDVLHMWIRTNKAFKLEN